MFIYEMEINFLARELPEITGYKKIDRTTCQKVCDETIGRLSMFAIGATGALKTVVDLALRMIDLTFTFVLTCDKNCIPNAKFVLINHIKLIRFFIALTFLGFLNPNKTMAYFDTGKNPFVDGAEIKIRKKFKFNCLPKVIMYPVRVISRLIQTIVCGPLEIIGAIAKHQPFKNIVGVTVTFITAPLIFGMYGLFGICNKSIRNSEFHLS